MRYDEHVLFNYCNNTLAVSTFIDFNYNICKVSSTNNEFVSFLTSAHYLFYIFSYDCGFTCLLYVYKDYECLFHKKELSFNQLKEVIDNLESILGLV